MQKKARKTRRLVYAAVTMLAMTAHATPVQAALITEPLTATVTAGPFAGTIGYGTFSYDSAELLACLEPANGFFATPGIGSFGVTFTIFGQTFTEANDMDYPIRPYFQINAAGVPITLDFAISRSGNEGLLGSAGNPTIIAQPDVSVIAMSTLSPAPGGGFNTEVSVRAVPEPSGSLLFVTGLLSSSAYGWRKTKHCGAAHPNGRSARTSRWS